jgi:hypothetical protein
VSDDGVASILRKLEALEHKLTCMDLVHSEDMAAIGARINVLTEAAEALRRHHYWVGNAEQIQSAIRESVRTSSANLVAIEYGK